MSIYVVYGSRYGASEECAKHIAKGCNGNIVKVDEVINLDDATAIMVGSSVYIGQLHKDIKTFLKNHEVALLNIPMYFYVCGLSKDAVKEVMDQNVSEALRQHIRQTFYVGGILNFPKMSFFERNVIAIINKKNHMVEKIDKKERVDLLDYEALHQAAQCMKKYL